ncbi:MFS transporter [Novosphingobium sp. Gsoil 351]|uniref:spinster family MFS transporter n=1 Tax=Novosphingobium sp. Gsoil 351 TaxID=2675225 RepID=UPI0012B45206|nr:MFS transporter [Novosphingobium sp. Gsoil 351]QGN54256.1 MFS transporter [Novosphingobium sp. Gsoil 351]
MPAPITDPETPGPYRWYVLGVLVCTGIFSIADRLVLSILLEDIKAEFALSDTQLGLLTGLAFSLFYVTFGFPFARLADRRTRKTIIAFAITLWSAMTALCGAALGFWSLFFARMGVGVGEAASGPAGQSLIADYFRRHELGRAMGVLSLGSTIGTATGLIAGGLLAQAFGWRMAFVLLGAPGIVLGALLYLTVREPPRGRYAPGGAAEARQRPLGETIRRLAKNRVYLGVMTGWAVQIMIGYAIAIWTAPVMIRQFGVTPAVVGTFLGLAFIIGGIPGPILGGLLTDRLARRDERWRAWLPGIAGVACIVPLALALNQSEFWPFLALFVVFYAIFLLTQAPILSLIQTSLDAGERAFGVALALFFNNLIGQTVGAGTVGWLSDRLGPGSLGAAILIVCAVGGVLALAIFLWTGRQMRLGAG